MLVAILTVSLVQLLLWRHLSDDAYVTFRYVERFLDGRGLTFNDGERVEGYSHALWVFLLILGRSVSEFSVVELARGLGVASTLLTFSCLLGLHSGHSSPKRPAVCAALAVGLSLVFPGSHMYSSAGLETPVLGFLITLAVLLALRGRLRFASCAFGLAGVCRPEGLLYGVLWVLFTVPRAASRRELVLLESSRVGLVIAPAVLYEIFRIAYFGAWLPNTVMAKPPGTFGGLLGLDYLWQAFLAAGGIVVVGLMCVVRVESESDRRLYRHIAGPILASVILVLYAWGDWMPFSRFLTPVWPLVALGIAHWIVGVSNALSGRVRYFEVNGTIGLLFLLFALSTLGAYGADLVRYAANDGLAATLMRGEDQLAVGKWMAANLPAGTTVVTRRLGAMSYAAPDLTFWDELGLTDREQAQWIARGRPGGDAASPVFQRDPDVVAAIAVPASWSYTENAFLSSFLESRYTLVKKFPQGNYGEIHVWVRSSAK